MDTGNEEQLYDPGSPHMEKFNYDPELAGAALTGEDSRMLSNAGTVTKLRTHLAAADFIDHLAERIRTSRWTSSQKGSRTFVLSWLLTLTSS
jgi:hypothetical protein